MVQDLLGFSRKTDVQARALRIASQTVQYVRIFDQLQRRRRFALFLDFLSVLFGAPVSNGGHHDCRVGGKRGVNGGLHFARCFNVDAVDTGRSEEHTSELQSLMRISYAVFCLKKKKKLFHYYISKI